MNIWPAPAAAAEEFLPEPPVDDAVLRRWQESLDALERQAEVALGLTANPPTPPGNNAHSITPWTPPADVGPLPEILRDRALALTALQQRAVRVLAASRAGVEQELAGLARPRKHVQSLYMDVTG